VALLAGIAAMPAASTLAHAGRGPAITVTAGAMRPGGLLEVTGSDFEALDRVAIDLVADGVAHPLSTVASGEDGHFFDAVRLPAVLAGGIWEVRAVDGSGVAAVARVVVDAPVGARAGAVAGSGSPSGMELIPLGALAAVLVVVGGLALRSLHRGSADPAR
jgi:hypothetical protein